MNQRNYHHKQDFSFGSASFSSREGHAAAGEPTVLTTPEMSELKKFHELLGRYYMPEAFESLGVFRDELLSNRDNTERQFICALLHKEGRLVSGAYGSVQDGVLAIRFALTEIGHRGRGISYETTHMLIEQARGFSAQSGRPLRALIGEWEFRAELFANQIEIEPDNSMRRLYAVEDAGRTYRELYYHLPPLEWQSDGRAIGEGSPHHLQVCIAGQGDEVEPGGLEQMLRSWWNSWYVRPPGLFKTEDAWARHRQTVNELLDKSTLGQIREARRVVPLSATACEMLKRSGQRVISH